MNLKKYKINIHMKRFFLICFTVTILHLVSFSQSNFYQRAFLSTEVRSSGIGCAAGGKGYMGFGQNNNSTYMDDLWEYDTAKNSWTQMAGFPGGGRVLASAYTVKNKIYV